jgi:hypothetical protein
LAIHLRLADIWTLDLGDYPISHLLGRTVTPPHTRVSSYKRSLPETVCRTRWAHTARPRLPEIRRNIRTQASWPVLKGADGQVCLADAGRSEQQHVLLAFEEGQPGQLVQLAFRRPRAGRRSRLVQALVVGKVRPLRLQAHVAAVRGLALGLACLFAEVQIRQVPGRGRFCDGLIAVGRCERRSRSIWPSRRSDWHPKFPPFRSTTRSVRRSAMSTPKKETSFVCRRLNGVIEGKGVSPRQNKDVGYTLPF